MGSAQEQGRLWGAAADDWVKLTEPLATPTYQAVFDAIDLKPGMRLFDAGCGSGLALVLARERGAHCTGLDASDALVAIARDRLPDADIRVGELEELPFADESFDAVTAINAVQFAADPVNALREIKRVAKAGAPVAIVTWGSEERSETRSIVYAVGKLLPPPPPGTPGPFALSAPGALEDLAGAAGLTPQHADDVPVSFVFPDLDTAVRAHLATGHARLAIELSGLDRTREAMRAALADSIQPDGQSRQDNVFRYLIATA